MTTYHCPDCKKDHKIYPGLEIPPPEFITKMSPEERELRVKDFAELIVVDNQRVFGNGYIFIYMEGQEEAIFSWHGWAELSLKDAIAKVPALKHQALVQVEGTFPGIPIFYDNSESLQCLFTLSNEDQHSEIIIIQESQLQKDQKQPITKERMIALMNRLHHMGESTVAPTYDAPFAARFREVIEEVKSQYLKKGKEFALNLLTSQAISFQLVGNSMLKDGPSSTNGIGLYLPFDQSDPILITQQKRFLATDYADLFTLNEWDGIPIHELDIGQDYKRLQQLVLQILTDVFEEDIESVGFEHFSV